jgi:hypothetical protein
MPDTPRNYDYVQQENKKINKDKDNDNKGNKVWANKWVFKGWFAIR